MTTRLFANNFKTTLASGIGTTDTSLILVDASKAPAITSGQMFSVTLDSGSAIEIINVTGVSGNTLTGCTRGQEGTTASSFLAGTRVELRATATTFTELAPKDSPALTGTPTTPTATSGTNTTQIASTAFVTTAVANGLSGSGFITSSGRAYPRRSDGTNIDFIWSGQGGQPTYVWGSMDGSNMYVWNPANFSVNYATTAGSANTLGGYSYSNSGGANTIVQRDANGHIQNNYFNTSLGGAERNASGMGYFAGFNTGDYYIRSYTNAAAASIIQSAASGTWGINVTGSAGSVAWTGVSGRPTNVSTFNNDSGYLVRTSAARPGVYKIYRRDSDSDYSVQVSWETDAAGYWSLRGYSADTYHAGCYVALAGTANSVAWANVSGRPTTTSAFTNDSGYAPVGSVNAWTASNRGAPSSLPATSGTVTLNMNTANNFDGTLTGAITLANPSNMNPGQSGVIRIVNGATPYTIAYGSYWKSASGVMPALTSTANAVDVFGYYIETSTRITIVALKDVK